jgi:pimeloyl-ACP methyl ester carboxylesterase
MHPMRFVGFIVTLVLLVVLVGPLILPVPPLPDPVAVSDLADPDSKFIEVNSIQVHYKQSGAGEPVILLMHGFSASTYSWHKVMEPLAEIGTVIAYDRPAFGLTERPLPGSWTGENPYGNDAQVKMAIGLMDALGVEKAVLIGHSAGGSIGLQAALEFPGRVSGLVLVDAVVNSTRQIPDWLASTPQVKRLGPYLSRSLAGQEGDTYLQAAWHDPGKFTQADKDAYRKPFQTANWDTALWEYTLANRQTDLVQHLGEITMPVLVMSGDDDKIVPQAQSEELAGGLPNRTVVVLSACGHVPQEECPEEWLPPVLEYLGKY